MYNFRTRHLLVANIIFIFLIVLGFSIVFILQNEEENKVGKFGKDYWFDGNNIITANGWNFRIINVSTCNIEGEVLGTKRYYMNDNPSSAVNTFSPLDILIGIENIIGNTSQYDYHIESWRDRKVEYYISNDLYRVNYFKSHCGNLHVIPHNKEVYDALFKIEKNDIIVIKGMFVNVYGENEGSRTNWETDTKVGNEDCEIILIDEITINGRRYR